MTDLNIYSKEQTDNLLADKASISALAVKQDTLVSGTTIKTINGESLLGSGDITVGGGSAIKIINVKSFGWGDSFAGYHAGFDNTKVGIAYEIDGVEYVDTVRSVACMFISSNGVKVTQTTHASDKNSGMTVTEILSAITAAGIDSNVASRTSAIQINISSNKSVGTGYTSINGVLSVIGLQYSTDLSGFSATIYQKILG